MTESDALAAAHKRIEELEASERSLSRHVYDLTRERDELRRLVADFLEAFDKGYVELNFPDINDHGKPTHAWHDEWLHLARAALEKVND